MKSQRSRVCFHHTTNRTHPGLGKEQRLFGAPPILRCMAWVAMGALHALALSGCAAGVTGAIIAIAASGGGGGGGGPPPPPVLVVDQIGTVPVRAGDVSQDTIVGKVIVDYHVEDVLCQDFRFDLAADLRNTQGQTIATLSTADGTLTEATGPICDGASGGPSEGTGPLSACVSPKQGYLPHRFIWNMDSDIDRLVCQGTLEDPRVSQAMLSVSASTVLPQDTPPPSTWMIDNRRVHSIAGLVPGQLLLGRASVPAEDVTFDTPSSVAVDGANQVMYIADAYAHAIYKMKFSDRILVRIAGIGIARDPDDNAKYHGGLASAAAVNEPTHLELDSDGRLYFSEGVGSALWMIDEAGDIYCLLGNDIVRNVRGFTIDEDNGFIYVADTGNCRIVQYPMAQTPDWRTAQAQVIYGVLTQLKPLDFFKTLFTPEELECGIDGCDYKQKYESILGHLPLPTPHPCDVLCTPSGVALFKDGGTSYLFVSDKDNSRILRLNLDAADIAGTSEAVLTTQQFALLCTPTALRVFAGRNSVPQLYAILSSVMQTVLPYVKGIVIKTPISTSGGAPVLGAVEIVAGTDPSRLIAGELKCGTLNVASNYDATKECGPPTDFPLSMPSDVLVDSRGQVYICDSRGPGVRLIGVGLSQCSYQQDCSDFVQVSDAGRIRTFVGTGNEGRSPCEAMVANACAAPSGATEESAIASRLSEPMGMVLVDGEFLLIADRGNDRIRRLDLSTGLVSTIAGRPAGCEELEFDRGDGGSALQARFQEPRAVAVSPRQNFCANLKKMIFIVDSVDHRVRMIDASGLIWTIAGSGDAAVDTKLSCNTSVNALSVCLKFPRGIVVDSRGRVFVSDSCRHRIVRLLQGSSQREWLLSRVIGVGRDLEPGEDMGGCEAVGSLDDVKDGGPACAALLNRPGEMAFDAQEEYLYIADSENNRVRRVEYNPLQGTFGTIVTVAGNGEKTNACVVATPAPALQFAFSYPYGVALDPGGQYLYFSENAGASKIFRVTLDDSPAKNTICRIGGGKQYGSIGDGDTPLNAQFLNPNTLQVDCAGNLYVLDSRNHRLRKFWPVPAVCTND